MKKAIIPILIASIFFASCSKDETTGADTAAADFTTLKATVITDFVNVVAVPGYTELKAKAAVLNTAVITLNTSTTEANLTAAKTAWKDMRSTWEKCEGYLFGPVDVDEHDPETDTWPVNFNDMDALLADNSHSLSEADIESLTNRALKGYHPIEYVLWGKKTSPHTSASLSTNSRQKLYIVSLAAALKEQADELHESWIATGGNYAKVLLTAGTAGNVEFPKKQDAYLSLLEGLTGICSEVGDSKMKEPFDAEAARAGSGAELVESPYSGNSISDFKNNITGAYNVYLGKFNAQGKGITDLVKAKNTSLDVKVRAAFESAIGSFDNITKPFEEAIVSERIQVAQTMARINDLATLLDTGLRSFIVTNITD